MGDEPGVVVRRAHRAGYRGLVANVSLDGEAIGLVHLSGRSPAEELTELWEADALDGANLFLTEQEAIQRTVSNARRRKQF